MGGTLPPRLTEADGAELHALIEECEDGQWRASGYVQVDEADETLEQTLGIEMFPDEDGARKWANDRALARGFKKYKIRKRILSSD
jgi:hypothetical protein